MLLLKLVKILNLKSKIAEQMILFKVTFHVNPTSRISQTLLEWSFLFEVGDGYNLQF